MPNQPVPIVVVQDGQLAGRRWPLDKPSITLGRGEECDIVLPDRQVSRRHVRLWRAEDGF